MGELPSGKHNTKKAVIVVGEAEGGARSKYKKAVVVMGDASEMVVVLTLSWVKSSARNPLLVVERYHSKFSGPVVITNK